MTVVGTTKDGHRVEVRSEKRATVGLIKCVFVYSKNNAPYRVTVPKDKTAQQFAEDIVQGKGWDPWKPDQ